MRLSAEINTKDEIKPLVFYSEKIKKFIEKMKKNSQLLVQKLKDPLFFASVKPYLKNLKNLSLALIYLEDAFKIFLENWNYIEVFHRVATTVKQAQSISDKQFTNTLLQQLRTDLHYLQGMENENLEIKVEDILEEEETQEHEVKCSA